MLWKILPHIRIDCRTFSVISVSLSFLLKNYPAPKDYFLISLIICLMLGGIGGRRRRGQQRMRQLDGITDSRTWVWVNSGSWWWTGRPGMLRFMGLQRVGHNWATQLNWRFLWRFCYLGMIDQITGWQWLVSPFPFPVGLLGKIVSFSLPLVLNRTLSGKLSRVSVTSHVISIYTQI